MKVHFRKAFQNSDSASTQKSWVHLKVGSLMVFLTMCRKLTWTVLHRMQGLPEKINGQAAILQRGKQPRPLEDGNWVCDDPSCSNVNYPRRTEVVPWCIQSVISSRKEVHVFFAWMALRIIWMANRSVYAADTQWWYFRLFVRWFPKCSDMQSLQESAHGFLQ